LQTWTGATHAFRMLLATGRVFATGNANPGFLFALDPTQPAGAVTTIASGLLANPAGIAFDGGRIWVAIQGTAGGEVQIYTPGPTLPWTVTTVTTGFNRPFGALYDGSNVWVTDSLASAILKLDANGVILQTVTVGVTPTHPIFDGSN